MTTSMHRLQISLPQWEVQYLEERARREGRSIADLIRHLVQQEAERQPPASVDSIWSIAGIGEEPDVPPAGHAVSAHPERYLADAVAQPKPVKAPRRRRPSLKSRGRL